MDTARVGAAIKLLRVQAGYTQHELAECLNVTDKAVSKWERGLSVPDVSIITKLSMLLNCDVDNLLEGNITYLEKEWQGLLILSDCDVVFSGSEAYGKPLVYLYLSYFLLAGIGDIYISCPVRDREYISERLGTGADYGISLIFLPEGNVMPPVKKHTMVVYRNPFLYGANLTKYFQRAMSRQNGISVLTTQKTEEEAGKIVCFDNHRSIKMDKSAGIKHTCLPVLFFPKKYYKQIPEYGNLQSLNPVFAEPTGNGLVAYSVTDQESLLDTAMFLRLLSKRMGKNAYELNEVAKNRNFI